MVNAMYQEPRIAHKTVRLVIARIITNRVVCVRIVPMDTMEIAVQVSQLDIKIPFLDLNFSNYLLSRM